jgi:hypothetical protein
VLDNRIWRRRRSWIGILLTLPNQVLDWLCRQTLAAEIIRMTESRGSRTRDRTCASSRPPMKLPGDRSGRHHKDEAAVLSQHGEAAITAVAGEAHDHSRQADGMPISPGALSQLLSHPRASQSIRNTSRMSFGSMAPRAIGATNAATQNSVTRKWLGIRYL